MNLWRLEALADVQRERLEAMLREKRVLKLVRDQSAGEKQRRAGFKRQVQSCALKLSLIGLAAGVLTLGLVLAFRLAAPPKAEAHPAPQPICDAAAALCAAVPGPQP
jgi:hypothetical protein